MPGPFQVAETGRNTCERFEFVCRTPGNAKESYEIAITLSSGSFGDVG
jgi:hypothetical protein